MKPGILLQLILVLLISQSSSAQTSKSLETLTSEIDSLLTTTEGNFAVAYLNPSDSEKISINVSRSFHAASTMKTPVMIEVFKQAEAGNFSLEDSLLVENSFKSIVSGKEFSLDIAEDSGDKLYGMIGSKVPIEELVVDMIINSSNLATNLLIELVDAKKVTQSMRDLGAEDILVLRGVEDIDAYEAGLSNTTTALDLMLIFEALSAGNLISPQANAKMIEILLRQQHNEIIPARLPAGTKVAHKTGSITGVRHDSGIVILPDGTKYILVLLSDELEDPEEGIKVMSQVSQLIFNHVSGH